MRNTQAPASDRFYGHLVVATLVQSLVVVVALATEALGLWAAILLLMSALTLAAHAAHLRRHAAGKEQHR